MRYQRSSEELFTFNIGSIVKVQKPLKRVNPF